MFPKTYGGEYERKKEIYADLGIRYYAIYRPNQRTQRKRKRQPLEVYVLVDGQYQRMNGNPVWLPEIGLALGRERGIYLGREREWLYWYDEAGNRLLTPEERIQQEQDRAEQIQLRVEQEQARAERLAEKLKELGLDPDSI